MKGRIMVLAFVFISLLICPSIALANERPKIDPDTISRIDLDAIIAGAEKLLEHGYTVMSDGTTYWKGAPNDDYPQTSCYIFFAYQNDSAPGNAKNDEVQLNASIFYNDDANRYDMIFGYLRGTVKIAVYSSDSYESYKPVEDEINLIMDVVTQDKADATGD